MAPLNQRRLFCFFNFESFLNGGYWVHFITKVGKTYWKSFAQSNFCNCLHSKNTIFIYWRYFWRAWCHPFSISILPRPKFHQFDGFLSLVIVCLRAFWKLSYIKLVQLNAYHIRMWHGCYNRRFRCKVDFLNCMFK